MSNDLRVQLNFIQNDLPKLIVAEHGFKDQEVVQCSAESKTHLDGFMSSIFMVKMTTKDSNERLVDHNLIVKIMKGDESFRQKSKAFLQSSNEVSVYKTIIPYFSKFCCDAGVSSDWIANIYFVGCDVFPALSPEKETILALEDLNSSGFRLCDSRIDLDEKHLELMATKIASYHAVSLAMKVSKDPTLEKLVACLIPFHFKSETQGDLEVYKYLCPISFERLFNYVARTPKHQQDEKFLKNIENLKPKVENNFLDLMENFLRTDHDFAVILHGDYYRNNVMFKYDGDNPVDLRMFDFQEIRYATIAIDLSIFMFMHVPAALKPVIWDELLKIYHRVLMKNVTEILKCDENDARLQNYSFDKFIDHFKKFAFYGVAVSVLLIPWISSPEEQTQKISDYFIPILKHCYKFVAEQPLTREL